jgi:hypothetical protein
MDTVGLEIPYPGKLAREIGPSAGRVQHGALFNARSSAGTAFVSGIP